jgi:hypothetical protein
MRVAMTRWRGAGHGAGGAARAAAEPWARVRLQARTERHRGRVRTAPRRAACRAAPSAWRCACSRSETHTRCQTCDTRSRRVRARPGSARRRKFAARACSAASCPPGRGTRAKRRRQREARGACGEGRGCVARGRGAHSSQQSRTRATMRSLLSRVFLRVLVSATARAKRSSQRPKQQCSGRGAAPPARPRKAQPPRTDFVALRLGHRGGAGRAVKREGRTWPPAWPPGDDVAKALLSLAPKRLALCAHAF